MAQKQAHTIEQVDVPFFGRAQVIIDSECNYSAFVHAVLLDGKPSLQVCLYGDKINANDYQMKFKGAKVLFKKTTETGETPVDTYDLHEWYLMPHSEGSFSLIGDLDRFDISWRPYGEGFRVVHEGIHIAFTESKVEVLGEEKLHELQGLLKRTEKELQIAATSGEEEEVSHLVNMASEIIGLMSEVGGNID